MSGFELEVRQAKLPELYEKAKRSLEECAKIDECKEWANKSHAMASYAKQAADKSWLRLSKQVLARAVRRYGELLAEIEPGKAGRQEEIKAGAGLNLHTVVLDGGGRSRTMATEEDNVGNPGVLTDLEPKAGAGHGGVVTPVTPKNSPVTRKEAGAQAGLSDRQIKTGLRVASIPKEEFERQIESEDVPSITALAAQGTAHRESWDRFGSQDCTKLVALLKHFLRELLPLDLGRAVAGLRVEERELFVRNSEQCVRILSSVILRTRALEATVDAHASTLSGGRRRSSRERS